MLEKMGLLFIFVIKINIGFFFVKESEPIAIVHEIRRKII